SRAAVHFFCRKNRRHLGETADAFGGKSFERGSIQSSGIIRTLHFSVGVIRVRRKAKAKAGRVPFATAGIELGEPRGAPKQENEYAGGKGIKRAKMADLPETGEVANRVNHIVRRLSLRLVDNERTVKRRRL